MTGMELVALISGICGFAAGVFFAIVFYAHTMASHTTL